MKRAFADRLTENASLVPGQLITFVLTGIWLLVALTAKSQEVKTIGTQHWSTQNLDVATFRNGDTIPEARTDEQWQRANQQRTPAWCYYDNNPANGALYGRMYNWYAVADPRELAPAGWHIPGKTEWTILANQLGTIYRAGKSMKSIRGWQNDGNGDNTSGFNGLPGGDRSPDGKFIHLGMHSFWSSTTEYDADGIWDYGLHYSDNELSEKYGNNKGHGFYIRCIKDR